MQRIIKFAITNFTACPSNCDTCTSGGCTQCSDGFYFVGQACVCK